ncbi:Glutathione S-transferase [Rubellimicrobium mesophilum DSM 19309]|uniref:glutathione transferase n=1 Tax=Rubellimicrobium mesophilum DSM 19309 TaxID=442562 RepID=A0A017HQZ0_9RHOB|nr:glutathione S-transferase family protein [Rubellimicrobium mesophilum]EYD76169.1 Glutathione S-transferase [Rubellimicrobium mesophilum DSM 19309]
MPRLELVSHALCPYVQRAVIALTEKGVPFTRTIVDLDSKPAWFTAISPLGKVPLLRVGDAVLFESAVICDYLDETLEPRLHPADPLERARHRAWIEFASTVLNDIWRLYTAADEAGFDARRTDLAARFDQIEAILGEGPWFGGKSFSLVDAAFGPVFRYFDVFDGFVDLGLFDGRPKVHAWRLGLAARASVQGAVAPDYPERLHAFVVRQGGHLGQLALRVEQAA